MISSNVNAIIVKVASSYLNDKWLGRNIRDLLEVKEFSLDGNYCGEGGEYETIVLDCDLFKYKIEYNNNVIECHPEENFDSASCYFMKLEDISLTKK